MYWFWLVPTINNVNMFNECNVDELIVRVLNDVLKKSDYRVFNLEVPLVDQQNGRTIIRTIIKNKSLY